MKIQHHTVASIVVSGTLYWVYKSWELAFFCFLSGIFIDLDYVIDYLIHYGFPVSIKRIYAAHKESDMLMIRIFHGWEWLLLLTAVSWISGWRDWALGILAGCTLHLFLDKFYMGQRYSLYSFIWRWKKGFKTEKFFNRE